MLVDPRLDHHLQKQIVFTLMKAEVVPFSALKPAGVESNLFMYHLRRLIAQDMVAKVDGGYRLTELGKTYVDRASLTSLTLRLQPKMITILAVQDDKGRWLLLERLHQPFLHYVGFPSGKLHYGEDLTEAAHRELKEKTGVVGAQLQLRGNIFMRFVAREEPTRTVNHICGYVFSGQLPRKARDGFTTDNFRSFWDETERLFAPDSFKGNREVLELLETDQLTVRSY